MTKPQMRPAGESERSIPRRFAFSIDRLKSVPMPAEGKQSVVHDERTPGLCMLTTSNGVRTFYWYKKVNGRPERVRIGRFGEITVEQARNKAMSFNGEKADGINPAEARRALAADATLGTLWTKWHEEHAKPRLRPRTLAVVLSLYNTCLDDWKNRRIHSINHTDVQRKLNDLGEKRGQTTANRAIQVLRRLLRYAKVEPNPCTGIQFFIEETRERYLNGDELARLLKAIGEEENKTIADFTALCLWTGQRRSNVASMEWTELDLDARRWSIPTAKFKSRKPHIVILQEPATKILQARKDNGSLYVFPGAGATGHLVEPKLGWKRILDRAGLSDVHIHDLRHTFASWALQSGADLPSLQKTMGHANIATTMRYAHLIEAQVDATASISNTAMAAAIKKAQAAAKKKAKKKQPAKEPATAA